ncbi:hypothetical protein BDN72DRAFT_841867, partial [Pluteus cervinus]
MTVASITLPLDILEAIIHLVHISEDQNTLRSLALVSKCLVVPVQQRLFRHIVLHPKLQRNEKYQGIGSTIIGAMIRLGELLLENPRFASFITFHRKLTMQYTPSRLRRESTGSTILRTMIRLKEVLSENPRLIPYVHGIHLMQEPGQTVEQYLQTALDPEDQRSYWVLDKGDILAEVLSLIVPESTPGQAQIRQFTISFEARNMTDYPAWDRLHPDLERVITRIFHQPTLKDVKIYYMCGLPRDLFFLRDPKVEDSGLEVLQLSSATFAPIATTPDPEDALNTVSAQISHEPSRIKSLAIRPLIRCGPNFASFEIEIPTLGPKVGINFDELEELLLELPTSVAIPSVWYYLLNRENGLPRLRRVHVDFKFVVHAPNLPLDPVWEFGCFSRFTKFPCLEEITFEGNSFNIGKNKVELPWMRELVPVIEAYTAEFDAASITANSPRDTTPPALKKLRLVISVSRNMGPLDDEILTTTSDRLHQLHMAALSCNIQKDSPRLKTGSISESSFASKSPLQLRIELKYGAGQIDIHSGQAVLSPAAEEGGAANMEDWRNLFKWGEEGGEYPVLIDLGQGNSARESWSRSC